MRSKTVAAALVDPFVAYTVGLPETVALSHVADPDDFLVQLAVKMPPTHSGICSAGSPRDAKSPTCKRI